MTRISNVFVIIIVIILSDGSLTKPQYRLKLSGNEYILRSCIASAQLTKNYKHNKISDPTVYISNELEEPNTPSVLSAKPQRNHPRIIKINTIPVLYRRRDKFESANEESQSLPKELQERGSVDKMNMDTPLKTVKVEAIRKDGPLLFRKKERLPELEHNISNAKGKVDASVIVIKSSI